MKQETIELLTDYDNHLYCNRKEEYDLLWQKRCGDCLAPCCFLELTGFTHRLKEEDRIIDEGKTFFGGDFVILGIHRSSWTENTKHGFNVQLNPPELQYKSKGLRVCPLAVNGKCIIYEDRPYICRKFTCTMKVGNFYSKKD